MRNRLAAAGCRGRRRPEGEWTVVDRTDGTKMWAYEGHPLYTYVEDKAPGEVTGDGKGGVWHVAKDGLAFAHKSKAAGLI